MINSIINNQIYDDLADTWWDENSPFYLLKAMVNPWRVPYFAAVIQKYFPGELSHLQLLDIGCGGGFLTEEYARLGCRVSGIDVSPKSIATARSHAQKSNLSIDYQIGSAKNLEFGADDFDIVSCCDVLEHILDWEEVIKEVARVLKSGGLFLFDTINRTDKSRATMIFGLQEWSFSKLFPADTHIWEMFITPEELTQALFDQGIQVKEFSGGMIPKNPWSTLWEVRRYKIGKISAAELGNQLELKHGPDLSQNYLGYAQKST
jgi:2-polyprenyl-6-hydroxyphenyl methylase/3-demethylubiquinone-9 3-methyltransferase